MGGFPIAPMPPSGNTLISGVKRLVEFMKKFEQQNA